MMLCPGKSTVMNIISNRIRYGRRFQSGVISALLRNQSTVAAQKTQEPETKPFSDMPGPSGIYNLPYVGTAFHFKPFTDRTVSNVNELFIDFKDRFGDIMRFRTGKGYTVLLLHPELIMAMYKIPIKYPFRPPIQIIKTYNKRMDRKAGFNEAQGEEWAALRKPLQQKLLRPLAVAAYIPTLNSVADDLVEMMDKKNGQLDDCLTDMYAYATESVGMLCFNRRLGTMDGSSDIDIMENMKTFFSSLSTRSDVISLFPYFETPFYKRFAKAANALYSLADQESNKVMQEVLELERNGQLEETVQKSPHLLISLLSDPRVTQDTATMMLVDLFIGGVESTSNALTILLHEMALHQDVQEKLYQEIKSTVGNDDLTKESLDKMSYLKACQKESLRRSFPVISGVPRIFDHDITLGGYTIPKHTMILASFNSLSKDSRFFDDPDDFKPERFIRDKDDKTSVANHPFAFLPFGYGVRSCIAQRFAETEIYVALTKILQNFKISLPSGSEKLDIVYKTFATPGREVKILLERRK